MKKIYVCSPYRATAKNWEQRERQKNRNIELARKGCQTVVEHGAIPIAPHLYFPRFLDDNVKDERETGMKMGKKLLMECDELWIFTNDEISDGMAAEIFKALLLDIPIRKFNPDGEEDTAYQEFFKELKGYADLCEESDDESGSEEEDEDTEDEDPDEIESDIDAESDEFGEGDGADATFSDADILIATVLTEVIHFTENGDESLILRFAMPSDNPGSGNDYEFFYKG